MKDILQGETVVAQKRVPVFLVSSTDGVTPIPAGTIAAGDLKITKSNSLTPANHQGTLDIISLGAYWYTPHVNELDIFGTVIGVFTRPEWDPCPFAFNIVANSPSVANAITARQLGIIESGVPNAVLGTNTITLKSGTLGANIGNIIDLFTVLNGEAHYVTGYSAGVATVDPPWPAAAVGTLANYYLRVGVRAPLNAVPLVGMHQTGVNAILDEVITSGHAVANSLAVKIAGLAGATDPMALVASGYTTPGTFGYIIWQNLNSKVGDVPNAAQNRQEMDTNSSRLSAASSSLVAIKTQTDRLTFTFAGVLDTNTVKIAGVTVLGNGTSGNKWRGS